ncbi:MAG: hypothetical protein E7261_04925 [Lachnospiraceae bacterium]|nr:hypothetical protein [Lachnospiraceae bacterium]
MKQEQIHDALNLLDDDLIEAVDALRGNEELNDNSFREKSFEKNKEKRNIPWLKYMSIAACLCVVILGAFALRNYKYNMPGNDKCNSVDDTTANDEDLDSMVNDDGLTGGPNDGLDGEVVDGATTDFPDAGATDVGANIGEVPSVLVRIDTWREDGFAGVVAGIVDTDIFSVGADIRVFFNEDISVGIKTNDGMRFKKGAPDKADFPVGSIVRVQFVKREQATEDTDNTKHAGTIFAELIAMSDEKEE